MKKFFSLLLLLPALSGVQVHSQIFNWANLSPDLRYDAVTDVLGNMYFCGVEGTSALGWSVEKYSPSGTQLWVTYDGAGGTNPSNLIDVEVAPNGDVYAIGHIYSGAVIGGSPVTVNGTIDYVLVKYNNQGVLQWSKLVTGAGADQWLSAIEITSTGDVWIAGTYKTSVSVGGNVLNSAGYHLFWAIFDSNGNTVSVTEHAGTTATSWNACLDANDNVYFAAFYNSQRAVMKMNANGTLDWSWSTGAGNGEFWDIEVDSNGDVYVTGEFDGYMEVNGNTYYPVSTLDDIFVIKVNAGGTYGWFNSFGSINNDNGLGITLDPYGHIFVTGFYSGNCDFDGLSLGPCGGNYETFFLKMDTSGTVRWALNGGGGYFDQGKNIFYDPYSGHIIAAGFVGNNSTATFGTFNFPTGNSGFVVSIVDSSCTSKGTVFRDLNANGTQDGGEPPFAHRVVQLSPGPLFANSGATGNYELYSNIGSYSITLPNVPLYHTLTGTTTHTATFSSLGEIDSLNHFALAPTPNMNDLVITLTPCNYGARSGMTELYYLTYENVGTTTISNAEVRFGFDNNLTFSAATPSVTSTIGPDSVVWNVGTLAPGDIGLILAFVNVPLSLSIGQPVALHVSVNPMGGDQTPGNNVQSAMQLVVNSWDPNEKRVFPEGDLSPADISAGTDLTYTIRFQNTGNDTAYFVRLVDTIDVDLDLSSFEFIGESHLSHWTISNGRVLTVDFEQINLVDSTTNEPLSHGFFKYRITPLSTLGLGSQISNTAHIYFDFNPAIVTNTVVTNVADAIGIADGFGAPVLEVFPNPASGRVFFRWVDEIPQSSCSIRLLDLQGKTLAIEPLSGGMSFMNLSGFAAGLYFYRLENDKGATLQSGKITVE